MSTEGRVVSILVEGAAAHSVSRTYAIKLGVVGTLLGTELGPYGPHFGTPHRPSLCAQESTILQSHLGTLHRPDPE